MGIDIVLLEADSWPFWEPVMSGKPASEDEFCQAVGRVSVIAATCDLILVNILRVISAMDHQTAKDIYYSLDAQSARRKIILKMAQRQLSQDNIDIVESIFDAAHRIATKRNELAHSTIMKMDDGHFSRLHLRNHAQPQRPITEDYLRSMVDPAWADLGASFDNYENLCKQLGVSPQISV